jgi:iron-sulfur cluster assembly protein
MESKLTSKAIQVTDSALEEIRRLRESGGHEGKCLRIGVTGGGCAGFYYQLDFDTEQDKDQVIAFDDVRLVVDPAHMIYLEGVELDYKGGLDSRGFIFNNPNAETTCGCGSSFG